MRSTQDSPPIQARLTGPLVWTRRALITVGILVVFCVSGFSHTSDDLPCLVVMETADAPGTVDRVKLAASLELTAAELQVSLRDLPPIVVFHLSQTAAAKLKLVVSSTVRDTGSTTRYELWIIGEPSDLTYSYMAENILEDHFKLKLDDGARGRILRTVRSRLDMTVNAKAFQKKNN